MFPRLLRLLSRPVPPPPVPSIIEIRAALARLGAERAEVDAALRGAFEARRAAVLRGDDGEADRIEAEIDALAREQERAELLERELLGQAADAPEITL